MASRIAMSRLASSSALSRKLHKTAILIGSMVLSFAAWGQKSNAPETAQIGQNVAHLDDTSAYVVTSSNDFGSLDLTIGRYTRIGHLDGLPAALGGLGTVDGKLYGGAIRTGNLYEISASNGALRSVGTGKISYFVTGSTTNALYAVGQDLNLYSIDIKSGTATLVGPTGFNPENVGGGALSSGSETLYMSAGSNYRAKLYSLNTATGAATAIGFIGSNTGAPPMVFENKTLYAAFNFPSKKICRLDTTTAAPTCFASLSGVPGYSYGLAARSSVTTNQVASDSVGPTTGARIVQSLIREQATSIELPRGRMYLYGMETGGGFPSSSFVEGQYAKVENADGKLSAALAYGTNNRNSYSTQTAYHTIGGVSVGGSWKHFAAFCGLNRKREAHDASVSFQTSEDSLVVVFGLAGDQKIVGFDGIPGLEVDASGGGELIAHAYVKPGTFNVVQHSVGAAGQDPAHMTDLVGIFVFGGEESSNPPAAVSESSPAGSSRGSDAKRNIRDVDFQNFEYRSNCLSEEMPAEVIHISNGQANNQDGEFRADKPVYGDLKGDGHELAAVALGCHPAAISPNVNFSEVFVFEMSEGDPKILAKLPPSFWKQERVTGLKVSNQQLAVDFLEMGDGFAVCPEWVVTSKFRWNGSRFVSTGQSRRKNSCAQ